MINTKICPFSGWSVDVCGCRYKAHETHWKLENTASRYEIALRLIANQDYRGNRPHSADIAEEALKEPIDNE